MLSSEFPTAHEAHDYELGETYWICKRCGNAVKHTHSGGTCIGVPIYSSWDSVPDTMATKTTLSKEHGKRVGKDQLPVGAKMKYNRRGKWTGHYYPLYAIAEADDKAEATPAQLEALEKARYMAEFVVLPCVRCGGAARQGITRKHAIELSETPIICDTCEKDMKIAAICQKWLDRDDVVILDTETTGLHGADAIQIAIINTKGRALMNTRVQTDKPIEPGATAVHGMTQESLKGAPTAEHVRDKLVKHLTGKLVLIYNADFDQPIIERQFNIEINTACVMLTYAEFVGDWSEYWGGYRWQSLPGGDHSALGDCRATLKLIRKMAEYKPEFERRSFFDIPGKSAYDLIEKHLKGIEHVGNNQRQDDESEATDTGATVP